jgi:hypothetical protein
MVQLQKKKLKKKENAMKKLKCIVGIYVCIFGMIYVIEI